MRQCILGAWNETDVTPTLLQGLQHLEREYGDFEKVGIATLMEGRIQHQNTHDLQNLQHLLQKQPLSGHFGMVYTCPKSPKDVEKHYTAHLCANERIAVVYNGAIETLRETSDEWSKLGHPFKNQTDGDFVLRLIDHYLEIGGISPLDALTLTLTRLQGEFAVLALFAEEDLLIVARRDCQLAIGVDENVTCFGSDTKVLTSLCRRVMQLEEGGPTVLRSVKGIEVK
jgi:glucosamine--fructose-6-phosphate aminotransferase (isomerizing)